MEGRRIIKLIAFILVIVGALNWALVGLFQLDVVARLLGADTMGAKIVYVLIGVGAIILLVMCRGGCYVCKKE